MNELKEQISKLEQTAQTSQAHWYDFLLFREHIRLFEKYEYDVLSSAQSLLQFLPPKHANPILQISGGPQVLTLALSFYGYQSITVEENRNYIRMIRQVLQFIPHRQAPVFLLSRKDNLPFPKDYFRFSLSFHLIRSRQNPWPIVKELERVVHPEGTIIIKDLNRNGIKLMREILEDNGTSLEPRGVSLLEIAEYFDKQEKFVNCLRDEFDTTLVITPHYQKIN